MAVAKPLVLVAGLLAQIPSGDTLAPAIIAGLTNSNLSGTAGITAVNLAAAVQTSLGLADSALQASAIGVTIATQRTLTAPAAGITVTNGSGVAGNPTLALANDLAALEALTGTSTIYYRSGTDTWTAVTVGGNLGFTGGTLGSALGTAATMAGPASTIVGISDTQTLTNKTLTTPMVNGATISGTIAGAATWSGIQTFSSANYARFSHVNQTDGADGTIGAAVYGSGLNIVGVQTTGGTGRQVRIWGSVIDSAGNVFWTAGNDGSGSGMDTDYVRGSTIGTSGAVIPLMNGAANYWDGAQYMRVGANIAMSASVNESPLQALSTAGGAAWMTFHRSGLYAVNIGLDTDNVMKIGGWSMGAVAYPILLTSNFQTLALITQDGTNAVARTAPSKIIARVNVSDFAGTDQQALERARDAAAANSWVQLVVERQYSVTTSLTFPNGCEIVFEKAGSFTIASGQTLTFAGDIRAPERRLFYGTGTVAGLRRVKPEWWGAVGDNTADDTVPVQAAATCLSTIFYQPGGPLELILGANYKISATITVQLTSNAAIRVIGRSTSSVGSSLRPVAGTYTDGVALQILGHTLTGVPATDAAGVVMDWGMRDFAIVAGTGNTATTGIKIGKALQYIGGVRRNIVSNVYVFGFAKGWELTRCRQIRFERCTGWARGVSTGTGMVLTGETAQLTGDFEFIGCDFTCETGYGGLSAGRCVYATLSAGDINGVEFQSCDFYGGQPFFELQTTGASALIGNMWINKCQFDTPAPDVGVVISGTAFYMNAYAGSSIDRIRVTDNYFAGLNQVASAIAVYDPTGLAITSFTMIGNSYANFAAGNAYVGVRGLVNTGNMTVNGTSSVAHHDYNLCSGISESGLVFNRTPASGYQAPYLSKVASNCGDFQSVGTSHSGTPYSTGLILDERTTFTSRLTKNITGTHLGLEVGLGVVSGGSTATPTKIQMDSTYSSTAGANMKLYLHGTGYGLGVSASQLDYLSAAAHAWWTSTTLLATLNTVGLYVRPGYIQLGDSTTSTASTYAKFGSGRTGNGYAYLDLITDTTYTDYGARFIRENAGANSETYLQTRGTGTLRIYTQEAANIGFFTTSTQRMIILAGGNVGIGNITPAYLLDVNGTINFLLGDTLRSGGNPFLQTSGNYNGIYYQGGGGWAVLFGGAADPKNYHYGDAHNFINRASSSTYANISTYGVNVGSGMGYRIAGSDILNISSSYTVLRTNSGAAAISIGPSSDKQMFCDSDIITFRDRAVANNMVRFELGKYRFYNLPTSSAGLTTGEIWNDSGTLKVA